MVRWLVTIGFGLFFIVSAYTIFFGENGALDEARKERDAKNARVTIEEFDLYRYSGDLLTGRMSGRVAKVLEPNLIEMSGNLVGIRYQDGDKDTVRCNEATATFLAENLGQMMRSFPLQRAELRGLVEVGFGDYTLYTDKAEYYDKNKLITSRGPVHIEGAARTMDGKGGFDYLVSEQKLNVLGPVSGSFVPESKPVSP